MRNLPGINARVDPLFSLYCHALLTGPTHLPPHIHVTFRTPYTRERGEFSALFSEPLSL